MGSVACSIPRRCRRLPSWLAVTLHLVTTPCHAAAPRPQVLVSLLMQASLLGVVFARISNSRGWSATIRFRCVPAGGPPGCRSVTGRVCRVDRPGASTALPTNASLPTLLRVRPPLPSPALWEAGLTLLIHTAAGL